MDNYKRTYILALFLIPLMIGGIVLSASSELKILENAFSKQAQQIIAKKILQQVQAKHPQLSPEEIVRIAQTETGKTLKSKEAEKAIEEAVKQHKSFFQESGTPYLLGTDTYYYVRYADNIIKTGQQTQTLANGTRYDALRRAPQGSPATWTLLPVIEAGWFKIWNIFSSATLMKTSFYLPVALGIISIALIFAIAFTVYKKTETAFFAAILFAVHPYFFRQNMAGFTDTTALIMPLSLAFFLSTIWIIEGTKKQRIIAGIGALLSLAALAYTWHAWYFVLAITAAFCIIWSAYAFRQSGKTSIILSMLAGITIIAAFAFQGYFAKIITKLQLLNIGAQPTVKELAQPTFPQFITALGDPLFSLLLLTAACWTAYRVIRKKATLPELFVLVWLLTLLFPAAKILRFMFFLAPPAVIITAALLQKIQEMLSTLATEFQISRKAIASAAFLIILPLAVGSTMIDTTNTPLPPMTTATAQTGEWLKQNANSDSILSVWWDYGYIWQYASNRATTLDAAPGTRTSRWTAKALLSEDETYSRNILRMIACSRASAEVMIEEKGMNLSVLEQALMQTEEAKQIFDTIPELYELTHCDPRETYLIIDKHTLDVINSIEAEALNTSEPVANKAPSTIQTCQQISNTTLECWGYTVDIKQASASKKDSQPYSVTIVTDGIVTERTLDTTKEISLIVYQEEDSYRAILVPPAYRNTLLVRLFAGEKTEHFELMHQEYEPERITLWKINSDKHEEPGQSSSPP